MFMSSFCECFPAKLRHHACYAARCIVFIKTNMAAFRCTIFNQSMPFSYKGSKTVEEYSKIDLTSET